ncbi:B12-binding domain-containing radical SAM protein [Fervidicoccus sp.]|uniref:B12-binding domain-containing radical SAM protein n=1 Tax=Fervidicoccus sp. TaxID=2060324 RepID=UPI003D0C4BDE
MRVALIASHRKAGAYEQTFGISMPPLSAAYLASVAKERGYDAKFFDAFALNANEEKLAELISAYDPDIAAFLINASTYANPSIKIAKKLKEAGNVKYVVAGGHHATFTYSLLLKNGFDVIFLREGEVTFSNFLNEIKQGENFENINSIAYIKDGREIKVNPKVNYVMNLDELPFPLFEIYDKEKYDMGVLDPGSKVITLETSRGCPFNCEYCSVTKMWGGTWRFKSVDRVIKELERVKELGYKWVFFIDDNFIIPIKKIIDERLILLDKIAKSSLKKFKLIVQLRADFVAKNQWIVNKLYEGGIRLTFLGIESGDPETLKNMRKNLVPNDSALAVSLLSKAGIIVHAGFILGAPYETEKAMNRTISFAKSLIDYGLDSAQFSIYTPLPGTDAFHRALKEKALLTLDWDLYDTLHPVERTKISPIKLFLKDRLAYYSFFLTKGIKGIRKGTLLSAPKREKDVYLTNGTRFIIRRIPRYFAGICKLPFTAIALWFKLRKKPEEEDLVELEKIMEMSEQSLKEIKILEQKAIQKN